MAKHFQTNEVDVLTNNVDLCNDIRTMTVSRNATNDVRTESERLAYGPMQFRVFGGGDRVSARAVRAKL